jgi:hypothetical protein
MNAEATRGGRDPHDLTALYESLPESVREQSRLGERIGMRNERNAWIQGGSIGPDPMEAFVASEQLRIRGERDPNSINNALHANLIQPDGMNFSRAPDLGGRGFGFEHGGEVPTAQPNQQGAELRSMAMMALDQNSKMSPQDRESILRAYEEMFGQGSIQVLVQENR